MAKSFSPFPAILFLDAARCNLDAIYNVVYSAGLRRSDFEKKQRRVSPPADPQ